MVRATSATAPPVSTHQTTCHPERSRRTPSDSTHPHPRPFLSTTLEGYGLQPVQKSSPRKARTSLPQAGAQPQAKRPNRPLVAGQYSHTSNAALRHQFAFWIAGPVLKMSLLPRRTGLVRVNLMTTTWTAEFGRRTPNPRLTLPQFECFSHRKLLCSVTTMNEFRHLRPLA